MTRILVTGASGFIGRALVSSLARSHQVRAGVRRPVAVGTIPDNVEVAIHSDLRTIVDRPPLLSGIDKVVHLAGIAHAGGQVADAAYDRVNCRATNELALAAAEVGVERLVFVSSIGAQSGPSVTHVLTENDEPTPATAYGRSKLTAEIAVRSSGVPFTILRPVLVYGPGVGGNMQSLIRLAALPLPLPLAGFTNRRSLLALDNLIGAIAFVLANDATLGGTFIVADPTPIRVADIVVSLRTRKGQNAKLFHLPPAFCKHVLEWLGQAEMWERLGGSLVADPRRLIEAGWRPLGDTQSLLLR
ncbi:MAG: hypothetical protein QOC56_1653 [Alphaproteobacteria bacterium]|nr:hypothetical protein [Alphaproteobacteria bacterium]